MGEQNVWATGWRVHLHWANFRSWRMLWGDSRLRDILDSTTLDSPLVKTPNTISQDHSTDTDFCQYLINIWKPCFAMFTLITFWTLLDIFQSTHHKNIFIIFCQTSNTINATIWNTFSSSLLALFSYTWYCPNAKTAIQNSYTTTPK